MTARLIALADTYWTRLDGWVASSGADDPLELRIDRFLNLVYYFATQHADQEEAEKFDSKLWMPPKGIAPEPGSPWSPEAESEAFHSLSEALNGPTIKTGQELQ